jgi:hypothetical protein
MAIWYEVEKNAQGIHDFLDSNYDFHDFRHERIEYVPGKDMVEIFLKYDTMTEGVLLRFTWIHDMHINTNQDYDADWLCGSTLLILSNGHLLWMDVDQFEGVNEENLEKWKPYSTWVESERIFWAITDGDGNPIDMPANKIEPVRIENDQPQKKCFHLKEFTGEWDEILKPYYMR